MSEDSTRVINMDRSNAAMKNIFNDDDESQKSVFQLEQENQRKNLSAQEIEFLVNQHKIDRMHTTLDENHFMTEEKDSRSAAENMQFFMDNYAVKFEIPSLYVQEAKIYPLQQQYTLQLVNYCVPQTDEY